MITRQRTNLTIGRNPWLLLILTAIFCLLIKELPAAESDYENGKVCYAKGEYTQALDWYKKAAEKGYAKAQCEVGLMYHYGKGIKQNYSRAEYWYRQAIEQEDASAQCNLGVMYRDGKIFSQRQDYKKAYAWFIKSAKQGDAFAEYNLGLMYAKGQGVRQNHEKAFTWYMKAAMQRDAGGQYRVGTMYLRGKGVKQNHEIGKTWVSRAAAQGFKDAIELLKKVEKEEQKALEDAKKQKALEDAKKQKADLLSKISLTSNGEEKASLIESLKGVIGNISKMEPAYEKNKTSLDVKKYEAFKRSIIGDIYDSENGKYREYSAKAGTLTSDEKKRLNELRNKTLERKEAEEYTGLMDKGRGSLGTGEYLEYLDMKSWNTLTKEQQDEHIEKNKPKLEEKVARKLAEVGEPPLGRKPAKRRGTPRLDIYGKTHYTSEEQNEKYRKKLAELRLKGGDAAVSKYMKQGGIAKFLEEEKAENESKTSAKAKEKNRRQK